MLSKEMRDKVLELAAQGKYPTEISRLLGIGRNHARRAMEYPKKRAARDNTNWRLPDDHGAYLPTAAEIEACCATFRQRKRDEDAPQGWLPPTMAVNYTRGRGARHMDWRRDDDAVPAA